MYKLTTEKFGKYKIYCLSSNASDSSVKFVLEKGATISDLRLNRENIYDGYKTFDDLESLAWGRGILLAPFPNRLKDGKYSFEGVDYQFPVNESATGTALHGFISQSEFTLGEFETNQESAFVSCHTSYAGEFSYYPFPFKAEVQYILDDLTGFIFKFAVTNSGESNMPIGLGWHPYFNLSESVDNSVLEVPRMKKIEIDNNMIPNGKKTTFKNFVKPTKIGDFILDNCFKLEEENGVAKVTVEGEKGRLIYSQSTSIPFLQIFTPPHRQSIALEPMTCNIDAFNNGDGLKILKPNETISLECQVKLERIA